MNQKERNEIRRRLAPDKNSIGKIYGCYVNTTGQIIARVQASTALMPELELEKYMGIFRASLGGTEGKNLIGLSFSMQQVLDSDEHRLLSALRNTGLEDEEVRQQFYEKAVAALDMEHENYLILLASDAYDVPRKGRDDSDADASDTIFRYILCAVCPVKDGRPELGYNASKQEFHGYESEQIVPPPVIGFMFPSFEDRTANIHSALYFAKNPDAMHTEFIDALFKTDVPMTAPEQKENFQTVLAESLEDDFSYDVMQSLHEQMREKIEVHKETKDPDPLEINAREVGAILADSGVPQEKIDVFTDKFSEQFGKGVSLNPNNLIEAKKFEVVTPQVKITVDPKSSFMVETRVIDGKKYILIPAGEGVEVNGMNVKIHDTDVQDR
ncbi:MAG: DUF4317 domain-containing protein [Clostridia bacterium]|nr:DUF4317 domain-containing protein [Clostridia bacterium]